MQPGRYVVAVSGGVDSVALLHLLTQQYLLLGSVGDKQHAFIVAHYDHGIRPDSDEDRKHVQRLAKELGLPFVYDEGHLGADTSEATARAARYKFLHAVRKNSDAKAIITAHHQDDVIETAFLNLLRGTHRKGMTSLQSVDGISRPLLHLPKQHIIAYAKANGLTWREDSTNQDKTYKRNYVRHNLVAKLTPGQREQLLTQITRLHDLNHKIDMELTNHLHMQPALDKIQRQYFIALPHGVAQEVLAAWLRRVDVRDFDKRGLSRMVVAAKTYQPGQHIDVNRTYRIGVNKDDLALKLRDR